MSFIPVMAGKAEFLASLLQSSEILLIWCSRNYYYHQCWKQWQL